MDVLLISLPKSRNIKKGKESIPVGLLYINAYLKEKGVNSEIIDLSVILLNVTDDDNVGQLAFNEISQKIPDKPLLIGINCFSSYQFPWTINLAQSIKENYPDIFICIGGSHPTLFAKEILENCWFIDFVVIGEGEEQVYLIYKHLSKNNCSNLHNIQSIGFRDNNRNIIINSREHYLSNLNIEPKKLWEDLRFELYYSDHSLWNNPKNLKINLAVPIVSSRSCPFSCNFCSAAKIMGPKLRCRDPQNVLDEIEYLNKERGQNYFEFVDDNINVNRKHATDIFSGIIERNLNIQISLSSGIHIASADEELIGLMAKAGLVMIKLPIEHGNEFIRNRIIHKKLEKKSIVNIVKILKKFDIFIFGLFIMGFPEDTSETLNDSYRLMYELELDIYETATLIPFPGTQLFEQCLHDNLFVSELSVDDIWKGIINFDASEHDKIYIKPYNMSINELTEYRTKFENIRLFSKRSKGI